jgi:hypothetical protein
MFRALLCPSSGAPSSCPKHVERCLRDKSINIRLIVHLVGCFIEYLKMHGITNPKNKHLPQHPVLEHSQPMFLPSFTRVYLSSFLNVGTHKNVINHSEYIVSPLCLSVSLCVPAPDTDTHIHPIYLSTVLQSHKTTRLYALR